MTRVADASGFQSVRRFNALFLERYRLNPESLRRRGNGMAPKARSNGTKRLAGTQVEAREPNLRLTLAYRPPLAWNALPR